MPASRLLQMVREDDFDGFESLCLEALEKNELQLKELTAPFRELELHAHADRAAALGQMVLENVDPAADPPSALTIARIALLGDPKNDDLRHRAVDLYRRVHGDTPGFEHLLEVSGLTSGRPARIGVKLIETCLSLAPGDALISRTEDAVAEVREVDLEHGLITLKHPKRTMTITPLELAREYERVASDDFRVLRALKPEQLVEMVQSDPVTVVIGLIHSHGEMITQDTLKDELVPKYIAAGDWAKWWTRAKAKCGRSPHVLVEGRSPVILRYTAEAMSLEDEAWDAFQAQSDPGEWLDTIEKYLREKKKHKEKADSGFLTRCHEHVTQHRELIGALRRSEALACALVGVRLAEVVDGVADDAREIALAMLRGARNPLRLIRGLPGDGFWGRALDVLPDARPDDAATLAAELIPHASAAMLDRLVSMSHEAELVGLVQAQIDTALADPVDYPEIIFWLWKGPRNAGDLRLPDDDELFTEIIQTLSALGRTLTPSAPVMKEFRARMRTALGLRDFARARECTERIPADRAITLRTQLERLEGLGDTAQSRLLNMLQDAHPHLWAVAFKRVEPWEDQDVLWNTAEGVKRRTDERDHLVNVSMKENARQIGEAASHGDLSENSEYKFALEERDLLRARLAQMNKELILSETIDPGSVPTDHIGVGSRVTLRDSTTGETSVITFLGPFDADVEKGIYNYRAPMSLSLMGLHVSDHQTLTLDDVRRELEVVEIANGLSGDA